MCLPPGCLDDTGARLFLTKHIVAQVNVKIFLSAYMIAAKPHHVFEKMEELENKVFEASKSMLRVFHHTAEDLRKGIPWYQVKNGAGEDLPPSLCEYLRTFKDWKLEEERKLCKKCEKAVASLERALRNLKEDEQGTRLHVDLVVHQKRLLKKIRDIERHRDWADRDADQCPVSDPRAPATVLRASGGAGTDSSPGSGRKVSTAHLVKDVLVKDDFQLDVKRCGELVHTTIINAFETAFWERLAEDLTGETPSYSGVLSVLTEIKTKMEDVAAGHPEAVQIAEIVDLEFIGQMLSAGALDYKGCEKLIDAIVNVLCSMHDRMGKPDRRVETVRKWTDLKKMFDAADSDNLTLGHTVCAALNFVMDRAHCAKVDKCNDLLKKVTPSIMHGGVEFLREQFQKEYGGKVLTRTNAWISHTIRELVEKKDTRVGVQDLVRGDPHAFEKVLYIAMVSLVVEYPNWGGTTRSVDQEDQIPETTMLDLLRVKALNVYFHIDVVSILIISTVKERLCGLVDDAEVRNQLVSAVQDVVKENPPNHAKPDRTVNLVIKSLDDKVDADGLDKVKTALADNVRKDSPAYADMVNTLKRAWYDLIKNFSLSEECRIPDAADVIILASQKRLLEFQKMVLIDKKVHVDRYNGIITKAVQAIVASS